MSDPRPVWAVRLSPQAAGVARELPPHAREMVRDVLDIAGRDPWAFPPFDPRDPEGEDLRSASVGQLAAVYWVNRSLGRLYVIDVVWFGQL